MQSFIHPGVAVGWIVALLAAAGAAPAAAGVAPPVLINEFLPAPASGAEWVELFNLGDEPLDLSGWKLDDDTLGGPQTTLPPGSLAPPSGLLVISLTTAILNNSGSDALQLLDPSGAVVAARPYSSPPAGQSYAATPDGAGTWAWGAPSRGVWNSGAPPTPRSTSPAAPSDTPTDASTPTEVATSTPAPSDTPAPTPTPALAVLINEYMPAPISGPEWVELFNPNDVPVDISGWRIDDSVLGGAQTSVPAGSSIEPGELRTVMLTSDIFNNSSSDAVQLLNGSLVIDQHAYGSAVAGQSYARVPDGSANWQPGAPSPDQSNPLPTPTPTHTPSPTATEPPTPTWTAIPPPNPTNTPPQPSTTLRVLINEYLPAPASGAEWVELFNPNDVPVDVSGWRIDDSTLGGTQISLPADSSIDPGELLVVTFASGILRT